ncbi:MAG: RNA polymerase sigma factor [Vicinamibacterales bacterium]
MIETVTAAKTTHLTSQKPAGDAEYRDLVVRAASGDEDALERLLLKAQEVAYRFSVVACGHADDAEDVMQEALLKTYRHLGRIRQPEFFRTWLYRTVRNACLMKRRLRVSEPRRLASLDDLLPARDGDGRPIDPIDPGPDPEEVLGNARLRRQIRAALGRLPGQFRLVVFLREMEGLSTREVADVMGISEANVKTRLHRARLALRRELEGLHGRTV